MAGKRKVSRPKVQARISVEELRNQFKRKVSLSQNNEVLVDPLSKAQESASGIRKQTGITYDEGMSIPHCLWDENYPECPDRFTHILSRCRELKLLDRCLHLLSKSATKEEILSLHTEHLYDLLKSTEDEKDIDKLESISSNYSALYIHPKSFEYAKKSVGCSIELIDAIIDAKIHNGMAIIRPPGHHCMKNEFCGYCYFNNVALAAKHALDKRNLKRILIVDWDVHHGQGTQQMFYDDPRVLYFSIHRYEQGTFWPHLRESDFDYVGDKAGKGYNFNLPLNTTGLKNEDYLAIFHQILLPVAYEFGPQLILVSAGYDASLGDEKGMMELTPAFYSHMLNSLMSVSEGKVAAILEGGYCLDSLSEGAALTLQSLMGDPCPKLIDPIGPPNQSVKESILNLIYAQRQYWKCLQYQGNFSIDQKRDIAKHHIPSISYIGPTEEEKIHMNDTRNCYPIPSDEYVTKCKERLDRLKKETKLCNPPHKVCLVYDIDMEQHRPESVPNEPERPARIKDIMKKLEEFNILDRVYRLRSRHAKRSELEFVHSPVHLDLMEKTVSMTTLERDHLAEEYTSTYFNQQTNNAAQLATGCLLEVVDCVCDGRSSKGVAVVRPPGHHAEIDKPYGFCFYNNVAVAAKYAIKKHRLKRILIFDWDIHHGNGIQHIFESSSQVLYISTHLYKKATFFPYSKDGDLDKVGFGEGEGFNVNIPWSRNKVGDAEYIAAMTQVILPIAYQFDPDLVLISAGFDAAVNDPLGGCLVTPECFGHMTSMLTSLAGGKVIMTLEGGYNLDSTSYSMTMCVKALLGDPLPSLGRNLVLAQHAVDTLIQVINTQSKYWSSLCFNVDLPIDDVLQRGLGGGKVSLDGSIPQSNTEEESEEEFSTPPQTPSKYYSTIETTGDDLEAGAVGGASDDSDAFIIELMKAQEFHAVVPLPWCPHLEQVEKIPLSGFDVSAPCLECHDTSENWICLTCYQVLCGRYVKKHMLQHGIEQEHYIVLSFSDLSVWCYSCESYIDHEIICAAKENAHLQKFGIQIT